MGEEKELLATEEALAGHQAAIKESSRSSHLLAAEAKLTKHLREVY